MKLCSIPIKYREGAFSMQELKDNADDMDKSGQKITLDYEDYGEIVTCDVPGTENDDDYCELTYYGIPEAEFVQTLRAVYNKNARLEKITAHIKGKEMLLYIYYENKDAAKQEIQKFALETADVIIAEIAKCKEEVARLFVEYFEDGDAMDFHAGVGTKAEKTAIEQKYPKSKDIADNFGEYSSPNIKGNNDGLYTRVKCADSESMDFFYYAVEIMEKRIREKAPELVSCTEDFQFISYQYD